jgi:hypothetical protein
MMKHTEELESVAAGSLLEGFNAVISSEGSTEVDQ